MAVLEALINSKMYEIGCKDGEQEYVKSLVAEINSKISQAKKQRPDTFLGIQEDKLFLYQLLISYSEIKELKFKNETLLVKLNNKDSKPEHSTLDHSINDLEASIIKLESILNIK